jgi:thioredoxin 1
MAPVLEELNKDLAGKAIILFVDVWKYRNLAGGVPIQVIPTQVFFDATGKPFTPPEDFPIQFNSYLVRDTNEHVFTTHEGGLDKSQLMAILAAMGMD